MLNTLLLGHVGQLNQTYFTHLTLILAQPISLSLSTDSGCHCKSSICHITLASTPAEKQKVLRCTVFMKNFHGSSDICPMGFICSIQICEISHQTFGPSHRKCPTCPMILVNTGCMAYFFQCKLILQSNTTDQ